MTHVMTASARSLGRSSITTATGCCTDDLDRAGFEALMNEAAGPPPLGTSFFDSMLGLAIRRCCAPLLDLEPHAPAEDYLARRRELGAEASRRLLAAAGIDDVPGRHRPAGRPAHARRRSSPRWRGGRRTRWSGWRRWPRTCSPGRRRRLRRRGASRGWRTSGAVGGQEHRGVPGRPDLPGDASPRRELAGAASAATPTAIGRRTRGQRLAGLDRGRARAAAADPRRLRRQRPRPARLRPAAADARSSGRPSSAASRCCCCTAIRSTATPRTWPRCSTTSSWTSGWRPTTPARSRRTLSRAAGAGAVRQAAVLH